MGGFAHQACHRQVVGTFTDANGLASGFVSNVPEPATLSVLGLSLAGLFMERCHRAGG